MLRLGLSIEERNVGTSGSGRLPVGLVLGLVSLLEDLRLRF